MTPEATYAPPYLDYNALTRGDLYVFDNKREKMRFAPRSISRFSNPAACPGAEFGLARSVLNVPELSTLRRKSDGKKKVLDNIYLIRMIES